jgi:pimeloyl-ACP methyl ester carboxylesterase
VTVDWRGQGESNAPPGDFDMDTLTLDAIALIEHLGVGPVHFAGLSMGGFVGMRIAARRPELIRSLTLLDTSAGPEDPEKVSRYRLLARVYRLIGIKPVKKQVLPIMFAPSSLADPAFAAVVDEWVARLAKVKRPGMTKAVFGVADREPIDGELGAVTAPTLVVVGAQDAATPVHKAELIAERIAHARLEVVEACGHSSTLEQPAEINRLLGDFVREH